MSATPSPPPAMTATPRPPLETRLRDAFQLDDPTARQESVLNATRDFLQDTAIRESDDAVAAAYYTSIAFSSGQLVLPDPAWIHRQGEWAVVALPEGMGLWLYDPGDGSGVSPLELSRWTVGITALDVLWGPDEAGILYTTQGQDGISRAHYILAVRQDSVWSVSWLSDEEPGWWFNARNAAVEAASDRSAVIVSGPAAGTTPAFYELPGEPQRTFRVEWRRYDEGKYVMVPPADGYGSRQQWLWAVAEPSPYATLVEFIERLQRGEQAGARHLADEAVIETALDFGLNLPERRYQLGLDLGNMLVFRDLQGTYVAAFQPPDQPGDPWRITRLTPPGARIPTLPEAEE